MSTSTHECPAPGCRSEMPHHLLACRGHWFQIPRPLRGRLLREYHDHFGERSYFEARADCLAALGVADEQIPSMNGGVGRRREVVQQ